MDLNVLAKNLVKYTGGYDNYIHVTKCTRSIRINYKYHKKMSPNLLGSRILVSGDSLFTLLHHIYCTYQLSHILHHEKQYASEPELSQSYTQRRDGWSEFHTQHRDEQFCIL